VQSQQLLMESQVLKDEVLMEAESAEQPAEQMSERHDHVKNVTETSRIQPCAKSFILPVYDVLARHNVPVPRKPDLGILGDDHLYTKVRQRGIDVSLRLARPAAGRISLPSFSSAVSATGNHKGEQR